MLTATRPRKAILVCRWGRAVLGAAVAVTLELAGQPSMAAALRLVTDQWIPYENLSDAGAPGFSTEVLKGVFASMKQEVFRGVPLGARNWSSGGSAMPSSRRSTARHNVAPQTEHFSMSNINEAFARLESGKACYRIAPRETAIVTGPSQRC
jgi:hypothetical protein